MTGDQSGITDAESPELVKEYSFAYTQHDPINITSDTEFIAQAALEGWSGNGSSANPFLIDGYNITHKGYKIRIVNVAAHFRISNCYLTTNSSGMLLDSYDDGICLINVSHASVVGNEMVNNENCGIYVESSFIDGYGNILLENYRGIILDNVSGVHNLYYNDVLNSTDISVWMLNCNNFLFRQHYVSSPTGLGMLIQNSYDCSISSIFDNCSVEIHDSANCNVGGEFVNGSGLVIEGCTLISVSGLSAIGPSDYGILVSRSTQISISQSTIESAGIAGIGGIDSSSCNYSSNIITDCRNGILLSNETSSLIAHNYIYNQTEYGIQINSGSGNFVYANLVGSYGYGYIFDEGTNNCWDDGLLLGNFMVGIEDGEYEIPGSAGSVDRFARSIDPSALYDPIACTDPLLRIINENEALLGWVLWRTHSPWSYAYEPYINGYYVASDRGFDHSENWVGSWSIVIDISHLPPGCHTYSLSIWGWSYWYYWEAQLSSFSFYYPSFYHSQDEDSDDMFDEWEVAYGLDPRIDDRYFDPDSDDLSNIDEMFIGTDPLNRDSDFDLTPDGWEVLYGFSPVHYDSHEDPDSDLLSNLGEYLHGTDPWDDDSDSDLIIDGWEVLYFLNPLNSSDANQDFDSDTLLNIYEFHLGTDPNSQDSDSDSIPDAWEVAHGFDPANATVTLHEFMSYNSPFINTAYLTLMAVAGVMLIIDRKWKDFQEYHGWER